MPSWLMNFLVNVFFPSKTKKTQETQSPLPELEAIQKERHASAQYIKFTQMPKAIRTEHIIIHSIPTDKQSPQKQPSKGTLLYIHGGGFCNFSVGTHRAWIGIITKFANTTTYLPEYRLAPENPFPAALDDVYQIYIWLINEQKILPREIVIGGDSSGGGLTVALLLKLKENHISLPAGAVLFSPWMDLTNSFSSRQTKAQEDPFHDIKILDLCAHRYVGDRNRKQPLISPIFGDLAGLPPLFIQVGSREILIDDSVHLNQKITEVGGKVELKVWDGLIHIFPFFGSAKIVGNWIPECKQANKLAAQFIQNIIS
jgi:monoterpene epsilon-lactone hydrolase